MNACRTGWPLALRQGLVLVTSALLVTLPTGCSPRYTLDPSEEDLDLLPWTEKITGISTHDGRLVEFDAPGGRYHDGVIRAKVLGEPYSIAVADVHRVYLRREGMSAGGKVAVALISVLIVVAAVYAIALATKESCPFIYSWDGERFVFDGEPYGGAITRGLERDDLSELEHLRAADGEYRILVTNEVRETQYTNLLELRVVDHSPGTRVAGDPEGTLHAFRRAEPPTRAVDADGTDLLPWLAAPDGLVWEPLPDSDAPTPRETVDLAFARPGGARNGWLLARAATGQWGSHMIRELLAMRGDEVGHFYEAIDESPAMRATLEEWNLREELYRLKIHVQEPSGWEPRAILPGGGPFVAEDRLIALDLSRVEGDEVSLRLQPPRGFWALDSFAMVWELDADPDVQVVPPASAVTEAGADVLDDLLLVDDRYYAMPTNADRAVVVFPAPPPTDGRTRTVFLRSRGYYRLKLDEGRPADRDALREITNVPGAAARLAGELFAAHRLAGASGQPGEE